MEILGDREDLGGLGGVLGGSERHLRGVWGILGNSLRIWGKFKGGGVLRGLLRAWGWVQKVSVSSGGECGGGSV